MLPVALDPARLPIALVGRGERAVRRLALLREAGLSDMAVYSDGPDLVAAGGLSRLPDASDLSGRRIVYVVGFDETTSRRIADNARSVGALVNVEDIPELCDFHNPSVLRRGGLCIAVSTGGSNPSLAKLIVEFLGNTVGPEWVSRAEQLKRHRMMLRGRGLAGSALYRALKKYVEERGWLGEKVPTAKR